MKRTPLLNLLYRYSPSDEEIELKKIIVNFIENYSDCFERSLKIGHITASSWLLNKDQSKALLLHHAKLDQWVQPGGHCDGDPDTLAVAIREACEESGITQIHALSKEIFDIDIHIIPVNSQEQAHYHYDIRFLLQSIGDEEAVGNRESKELRWIGRNESELPALHPSIVRMFRKWGNNTNCKK